jgi:hypothetical protein
MIRTEVASTELADRLAIRELVDGYAPAAAVADRRIKVVATVSSLPDLQATITAAGDWQSIMLAAQQAREECARSGRPTHVPFLADGELDVWRENGKKFYLTDRNQDPNWRNETLLWSYDKMIQFSTIATIDLLAPTPLLVIAGRQAETLDQSERLYAQAPGVKELEVIEGTGARSYAALAPASSPRVPPAASFMSGELKSMSAVVRAARAALPANWC